MTEEVIKKKKPKPRKNSPRMSARKWAEAEALWEAGEITVNELATKFGLSRQAFQRHFKAHGVVFGSKKVELKKAVSEGVTKAVQEDAQILAARIKETKEEHYKMASGLAKLTWAEILKAKQDSVPVGTAIMNLKALDTAASVLKKTREERYAVLGLDKDAVDENDVPELVISELTADQIEALRNRSFQEIDEIDVEVDEDTSNSLADPDEDGEDDVVEEK
jgi:AraC-like DNA-binding protein